MIPKPIDPATTTTAIWSRDLAIDQEASEGISKESSQDLLINPSKWRDYYKIKTGQQPTIFVIGVIPAHKLNEIEDLYLADNPKDRMHQLHWLCFLYSLRDIKNIPDGEVPKIDRDGLEYVDPKWLERVFIGPARFCAREIGLMAYCWNNNQDADLKN